MHTVVVSLYVEKDLSAVCKAVFDLWDSRKAELNYQILLASGARETPGDISKIIERGVLRAICSYSFSVLLVSSPANGESWQ